MFQVQPVRSKELQNGLCAVLGCEYLEECAAFYAGELSDDASTITSIISLCQFTFSPEKAVIKNITAAPGSEEDEAVFIMVRAVMNWCWKADIPVIEAEPGCSSPEYIKKLGFRMTDGALIIDLDRFYKSPCHYSKDEEN